MVRQIISIEHVFYRYPGQDPYVLKDISLSINEGEWLAIVGHNGSGKSTLAKMLNGLHYPEKGEVRIDTFPLTEETVWEIRKQIGMVFQNPDNQFVGTTVQDDVAFGLENNGVPQNIMVERVNHALERVNMHSFLDQEPHHLSGGQKQRVAIAGVIALQPKVIILDEATSMLDPKGRKEVLETIFELKEELGLTVISITHDLEEASKADRIVVLNKGEVYNEGTPMEIFQMQEELIELGLDTPFSIKMGKELEKQGFTLEKNYLTENELVDALWTLHLNK